MMIQKPLTNEQIWGGPAAKVQVATESANFCPYEKTECPYWEQGCQMEFCVIDVNEEVAEAQIRMLMWLESE